jgi:type III pantothenate kinase
MLRARLAHRQESRRPMPTVSTMSVPPKPTSGPKRLLTLDIGNSDLKVGIFDNDVCLGTTRLEANLNALGMLFSSMNDAIGSHAPFDALVYCSVVPAYGPLIQWLIETYFTKGQPVLSISAESTYFPVQLGDYPPAQLGADRLANLCGAYRQYPEQNVVVVDCGTATTWDVMTADGTYHGGIISPGYGLFCKSITQNTAKLPFVPLEARPHQDPFIGQNTKDGLKSGINLGYRGLLRQTIEAVQWDLGQRFGESPFTWVLTGGHARSVLTLLGDLSPFGQVDVGLTLKGLQFMFEFHTDQLRLQAKSTPARPREPVALSV